MLQEQVFTLEEIALEIKQCTHCRIVKELSDFYKNKKAADGHASWCKHCTKQRIAEQYKTCEKYRKKHIAYTRLWKAKNPAKFLEHCKRTGKKYRTTNRGKAVRAECQRRRAYNIKTNSCRCCSRSSILEFYQLYPDGS